MAWNVYTENLSDFGDRELEELEILLRAKRTQGLPDDFYDEGVRPAFNRNSGNVFLVNDDYQVAMMNGKKLESFYTLMGTGHEGFLEDLQDEYDNGYIDDEDDLEQFEQIGGKLKN